MTRSRVSDWPNMSVRRCCPPTPPTCMGSYVLKAGCSTTPSPVRPGKPAPFSKTSFIDRYVFPDGEIQPMATVIDALEGAGFEVRDVESLREHYSLTLRAWVTNLEDNWQEAVTFSSAGRARIWRLYMAGSALGFTANRLGVNQILAVKCDEHGHSGIPSTRTELLRSRASNP